MLCLLELQIASIVSCCSSGLIVLTLILWPELRRKLFMQIIACISICDLIGNLPYTTVSRPSNSSIWCPIEGFVNLYFYPVSWMWTTMLAYFLYSLAISGKLPLSKLRIHLICWGVPLVFTLLVLTTNSYGRSSDSKDSEVCAYSGNTAVGFYWHLVTYYGLWVVCCVCMGLMYSRVLERQRHKTAANAAILRLAMESLQLYPLIMFVFWLPRVVAAIMAFARYGNPAFEKFDCFSDAMKISHGLMATVVFFCKSHEARSRWYGALTCARLCLARGDDQSGRVSLSAASSSSRQSDFSIEYEDNYNSNKNNTSIGAESVGGSGGVGTLNSSTADIVVNHLHILDSGDESRLSEQHRLQHQLQFTHRSPSCVNNLMQCDLHHAGRRPLGDVERQSLEIQG